MTERSDIHKFSIFNSQFRLVQVRPLEHKESDCKCQAIELMNLLH